MEHPGLKVLLVEDDEDDYILTRALLYGGGSDHINLTWAKTFEDGLAELAANPPDIALVDYHLGARDGLELVRQAGALGCKTPFILMTGQGSYEIDVEAMRSGVVDYLEKFNLSSSLLERAIRYAIEHRQAQDALRKAHDELEQRVQERTRELAKANQDLVVEIAERKRAEAALRSSEARFRTLSETTSTAIFIIQDEKIKYANPAAQTVSSYSPTELLSMSFWELAHPAYQEVLKKHGVASQWIELFPARYELKLQTRQGDERWVDISAGSIEIDGQPAWVVTAFDITDRDLAEKELINANSELRQEVAERKRVEAALRQSEVRLQEALETEQTMRIQLVQAEKHTALSRLMASVAHELNNPIQTIQNCLFLVKQDIKDDVTMQEVVRMAISESERMTKLIFQLRATYRPNQPAMEKIPLVELLEDVYCLVSPHLQEESVSWQGESISPDLVLYGSRDKLKQVFLNICLNAVDAMHPNGGTIIIQATAQEDRSYIGVTVRDTGPGIAPENLMRIFDPFFTTKETGNGLGLYICYDIIHQHGGELTVESTPGCGAAFTVALPLVRPESVNQPV